MTQESMDPVYYAEDIDAYYAEYNEHYIEVEPSTAARKYLLEIVRFRL